MTQSLTIGQVASQTGVKVPTIRYYEQIGLLPEPPRTDGGRRAYGGSDVERLAFIRHARELGFDIDQIRSLLAMQTSPHASCSGADAIAHARLDEVRRKIVSLKALESELKRMVDCHAHGTLEECRVIEILADHGKCRHHGVAQ